MEKALAIITAAGSSTRFGYGKKKEYLPLGPSTVLRTCLDRFVETGLFQEIVMTLPEGHCKQAAAALDLPQETAFPESRFSLTPYCGLRLVTGGETRQRSVFNALKISSSASFSVVLIHDGARPWITKELISSVYRGTVLHGACLPVVQASDAIKVIDEQGFILEHRDRHTIYAAQTPQGFDFPGILEAHRRADEEGLCCVDDTEIYHRYIGRVFCIQGDPANRKITFVKDMEEEPGCRE